MEKTTGPVDFTCIPEGSYLCKVAEVRLGSTRAGDVRWSLRLEVVEGEHAGKHAAWDSIVWNARGTIRAHAIVKALGLTSERVTEKDLENRRAIVTVRPATYLHEETGAVVKRNEVPFDGYRPEDGANG